MTYPLSPFEENFDIRLLLNTVSIPENERIQNEERMRDILRWLCVPPKISSFRINTLISSVDSIKMILEQKLVEYAKIKNVDAPLVELNSSLPEIILVHNWSTVKMDLHQRDKEIIVDVHCGAAVLRGAHVFAPGVLGMMSGTKVDDRVSVYVDISGKCKKGFDKLYSCRKKVFIANGISKMARYHLFGKNLEPRGIAIEITDTISGCIPLGEVFPEGSTLLQNIPSVACTRVLNPLPGEKVLDMCASPGNKTTHIAALMQNKGTLIAIDKTYLKVFRLQHNCTKFNAKAFVLQADSTHILEKSTEQSISHLERESFDKILLDAPCSALGKRPQFVCKIKDKVLRSFIPLQRKLFEMGVQLLKKNGRLVYSTCTITISENEEQVAWALNKFKCLELIKVEPHLGEIGQFTAGLNKEQLSYLQRFGPCCEIDSVGFFIACFIKK